MRKNLRSTFNTRQYMISEDFEIFYYSDYGLGNLSDHSHDYFEFYFFLDGDVNMVIANEARKLLPGDMILIPPGIKHHVEIRNKELSYQRMVFWISRNFASDLVDSSDDYAYLLNKSAENAFIYHFDVLEFNTVQSRILQILEEIHMHRYGNASMVSLYVNELILYVNRCVFESENSTDQSDGDLLYENIMIYIDEHIDEELSLDVLSRKFFSSKYYISHIFKDNIGISVHQYILKKRLSLIRDSVIGNDDINKAILMYGFHDYSSFYRAFKKEYGLSPKDYKNAHKALTDGET